MMKWNGQEFEDSLRKAAEFGLDNCIGSNDCMLVCPVNRLKINQSELDTVMVTDSWTDRVKTFVTECIQCGDCTLACPAGVQRDQMMLYLKSQLPDIPLQWKLYYLQKGRNKDQSALISVIDFFARLTIGPLGKHIDKTKFEKKSLLFYFGCYIVSPSGAPEATLKLADRLGLDYEVLGGARSCCGWPQYLTGKMGFGQQMLTHLGELIDSIEPQVIVSGCAECYAALLRLKKKTGASWIPMTTTQWLLGHANALQWQKFKEPIAIHDSCHVVKKAGKPDPIRELLPYMADVVELYPTPTECVCCGYYNIHANHTLNEKLHQDKLELVQEKSAGGMVVECVTCWESFHETFKEAQVPMWDVMVAAEEATRPIGGV